MLFRAAVPVAGRNAVNGRGFDQVFSILSGYGYPGIIERFVLVRSQAGKHETEMSVLNIGKGYGNDFFEFVIRKRFAIQLLDISLSMVEVLFKIDTKLFLLVFISGVRCFNEILEEVKIDQRLFFRYRRNGIGIPPCGNFPILNSMLLFKPVRHPGAARAGDKKGKGQDHKGKFFQKPFHLQVLVYNWNGYTGSFPDFLTDDICRSAFVVN